MGGGGGAPAALPCSSGVVRQLGCAGPACVDAAGTVAYRPGSLREEASSDSWHSPQALARSQARRLRWFPSWSTARAAAAALLPARNLKIWNLPSRPDPVPCYAYLWVGPCDLTNSRAYYSCGRPPPFYRFHTLRLRRNGERKRVKKSELTSELFNYCNVLQIQDIVSFPVPDEIANRS